MEARKREQDKQRQMIERENENRAKLEEALVERAELREELRL